MTNQPELVAIWRLNLSSHNVVSHRSYPHHVTLWHFFSVCILPAAMGLCGHICCDALHASCPLDLRAAYRQTELLHYMMKKPQFQRGSITQPLEFFIYLHSSQPKSSIRTLLLTYEIHISCRKTIGTFNLNHFVSNLRSIDQKTLVQQYLITI